MTEKQSVRLSKFESSETWVLIRLFLVSGRGSWMNHNQIKNEIKDESEKQKREERKMAEKQSRTVNPILLC